MIFTQTLLFSLFGAAALAADEEAAPLRRLRQQTLHIPDLFEMADTEHADEWDEPAKKNTAQKLYEMDVFERLLQSDGSLSFSMPPTAPTPVVPTPIVPPPVKAPIVPPPVKAPIVPPPVKAPTGVVPTPVAIPTVVVVPTPVAVPVDTTCPYYPACAAMGLVGDCCPTPDGVFLDCCTATPPVMSPTVIITPPVAPTPVITPPIAPTVITPPVAPTIVSPVAAPKSKTGSMSSGSMSSTPTSGGGVVTPVSSPAATPKSKDSGMRRQRK